MAKILPGEFDPIALNNFRVGGKIRAADYKRLVERSHYLWATNRSRCPAEGLVGRDDKTMNISFRPKRLLVGDIYKITVDVYSTNIEELTFTFYRLDQAGAPSVITSDTLTQPVPIVTEWLRLTVDIDRSDLLQDGEVRPILIKITNRIDYTFFGPSSLIRVVGSEAPISEIDASDIPPEPGPDPDPEIIVTQSFDLDTSAQLTIE